MTNFQVDLNELLQAAQSWSDASDALGRAQKKVSSLQNSPAGVNWTNLFEQSWEAQRDAAEFVAARLAEGRDEAAAFHDVLTHVANVYQEHDQHFANVVTKITAEMDGN